MQNYWGQRDIIQMIITLNKRGIPQPKYSNMTKYMNYIYIYISGFIQNDWGHREIINKTKILTKQGSYTIHDVIPTKYQKYSSNTILKQDIFLDKVNKSP